MIWLMIMTGGRRGDQRSHEWSGILCRRCSSHSEYWLESYHNSCWCHIMLSCIHSWTLSWPRERAWRLKMRLSCRKPSTPLWFRRATGTARRLSTGRRRLSDTTEAGNKNQMFTCFLFFFKNINNGSSSGSILISIPSIGGDRSSIVVVVVVYLLLQQLFLL